MSHSTLTLRDISHAFGGHTVLDAVSLTIGPGERIGIVAPNGTGKTTLLKVIAGAVTPDSGDITVSPPTARVGYLPQIVERRDVPVRTFLAERTGVTVAVAAFEQASNELAEGQNGADDRYAAALDDYLASGAPDFDARLGEVAADVGLDEHVLDLALPALSGGQMARAALAALLLSKYDIYLLDEPTNDLDFAGLDRLEAFVKARDAGMLIVSHDRDFLRRTITSVLELDEASHTATEYRGTYDDYLDARAVARRHAEEAFTHYQDQRKSLQQRAQRQKEWTQQGVSSAKKKPDDKDKFVRQWAMAGAEKQASKISASERALERLEKVDKPWEGWELRLDFKAGPRGGDMVARLDGAVIERGTFRLGPLDLDIGWAERVALEGPNGSGKTTVLNALLGRLPLIEGQQRTGPGTVIGEIDQARALLHSPLSLADTFVKASGLLPEEVRSLLAKFGLPASHVMRPARSLSPGEQTRASLALLMAVGTNCLVLDEPTNHLDLEAIEQLEAALDRFDGTVLLITHDRQFLEKTRITRTIFLDSL